MQRLVLRAVEGRSGWARLHGLHHSRVGQSLQSTASGAAAENEQVDPGGFAHVNRYKGEIVRDQEERKATVLRHGVTSPPRGLFSSTVLGMSTAGFQSRHFFTSRNTVTPGPVNNSSSSSQSSSPSNESERVFSEEALGSNDVTGAAQEVVGSGDLFGAATAGASGVAAAGSSEVAAMAEQSAAPIAALQHMLEAIHVYSGLPWWASIALTTLAVRLLLFPVVVSQMRGTARMSLLRPEMERLQQMIKGPNSGDVKKLQEYQQKIQELFKKHKINPLATIFSGLAQAPFFIGFFFAIRGMAEGIPSFQEGGALWFTDLSVPDPTYIMPILSGASFLATVELGAVDGMQGQPSAAKLKNVMRFMAVAIVPLTVNFPSALFCYWLAANFFSLAQAGVMRIPGVKPALGIPNTSHLKTAEEAAQSASEAKPVLLFTQPPLKQKPVDIIDSALGKAGIGLNQGQLSQGWGQSEQQTTNASKRGAKTMRNRRKR